MNIHEYQAKNCSRNSNCRSPRPAAMSVEEAVGAAKKLPGPLWVVKSQIHAGGRGRGKFKEPAPMPGAASACPFVDEVRDQAAGCSARLWYDPDRTGGKKVQRLYITDGVDIAKILSPLLVDRATSRIAIVASTEGGMDIGRSPTTRRKDRDFDHRPGDGADAASWPRGCRGLLDLKGDLAKQAAKVLGKLYEAFVGTDASQSRSTRSPSPNRASCWCSTPRSVSIAMLSRHPDLEDLRDLAEEEPMEIEASKYDLAYIKLDGDIGCMVNGRPRMATWISSTNGRSRQFLRRRWRGERKRSLRRSRSSSATRR